MPADEVSMRASHTAEFAEEEATEEKEYECLRGLAGSMALGDCGKGGEVDTSCWRENVPGRGGRGGRLGDRDSLLGCMGCRDCSASCGRGGGASAGCGSVSDCDIDAEGTRNDGDVGDAGHADAGSRWSAFSSLKGRSSATFPSLCAARRDEPYAAEPCGIGRSFTI